MKALQEPLIQIGLSPLESEVYTLTLQYGPVSVATLARLAQTARSTVYGAVERLVHQQFLVEQKGLKGSMFTAITFEQILALLKSQQDQLQKTTANLQQYKSSFEALQSGIKKAPLVKYYNAKEIPTVMYDKILESDLVRSIRDLDRGMKHYNMTYEEICNFPRVSPGKTLRILYDSPNAKKYQKSFQTKNYQIRLLPRPEWVQSDIMIMNGSYFHTSYQPEFVGIEINDPAFYAMQVMLFDQLWNSLKK